MEVRSKGKGRQEDSEASTRGIRGLDKAHKETKPHWLSVASSKTAHDKTNPSTPKKHHLAYSFFFSPQNPKSPNRFPVIHRANDKLFTIPPDSDPSASQPVDSLLITKGLVNIMDTVEYGTAKT